MLPVAEAPLVLSPALVHLLTPLAVPLACVWVERQQRIALARGVPLTEAETGDAGQIGVQFPERVRLLKVSRIALPEGTLLRSLARYAGLLSGSAAGLTLGYGILVDADYWRQRLLIAHELVHVMQYERLGGVRPFLREYIADCLRSGYAGAALELEATAVAGRIVIGS
jgi:hypothetical protein